MTSAENIKVNIKVFKAFFQLLKKLSISDGRPYHPYIVVGAYYTVPSVRVDSVLFINYL